MLRGRLGKSVSAVRYMSSNSGAVVRSTAASGSQVYESKRAVHEYLLFHYGKPNEIMPHSDIDVGFALNFAQRSHQLAVDLASAKGVPCNRALDIGCAVGGLSFELARSFNDVVGIDFSHHFVDAANGMKIAGNAPYQTMVQGEIFEDNIAEVSPEIDRSRVNFFQGDACNLQPELGKFDVILASNLLCRLPDPEKFLRDIPAFLNPTGILILISPYSWLDEYTDRSRWIGAKPGQESYSEVERILTSNNSQPLKLIEKRNIPFLIREHERKFQLGVSDFTAWQFST
jgi:putative 4-mercaptohistidine N1-methyltranferase